MMVGGACKPSHYLHKIQNKRIWKIPDDSVCLAACMQTQPTGTGTAPVGAASVGGGLQQQQQQHLVHDKAAYIYLKQDSTLFPPSNGLLPT